MNYYATTDQLREIDALAVSKYGMNSLQLMENAGAGASHWIKAHRPVARAVILCGAGYNGGDGFVMARHLDYYGFQVTVVLTADSERLRGDAKFNFDIIHKSSIAIIEHNVSDCIGPMIVELTSRDLVIDALLGTGARLPLRDNFRELVAVANRSPAHRIAIDVPTGFDGDTGQTDDVCFKAHTTLTFAALKPGFRDAGSPKFTGDIHLIPIGIPRQVVLTIFGD